MTPPAQDHSPLWGCDRHNRVSTLLNGFSSWSGVHVQTGRGDCGELFRRKCGCVSLHLHYPARRKPSYSFGAGDGLSIFALRPPRPARYC